MQTPKLVLSEAQQAIDAAWLRSLPLPEVHERFYTMHSYDDDDSFYADDDDFHIDFADPGGNSALRAASKDNPRNLPCPNCKQPNRLTPADKALHYVCDRCADRAERGGEY